MSKLKELVEQRNVDALERGIRVLGKDVINEKSGMMETTALHVAAEKGIEDIVSTLVRQGANVNVYDKESATPLHYACLRGHISVVERLVEGGAHPTRVDVDGNTPFHWASGNNKIHILRVLLKKLSVEDLNLKNKLGDTVLHRAARSGSPELISVLIHNGADISIANKKGDTALHAAVLAGKERCTEELLQYTTSFTPNKEGKLPHELTSNEAILKLFEAKTKKAECHVEEDESEENENEENAVNEEGQAEESTSPAVKGESNSVEKTEKGVDYVKKRAENEKSLDYMSSNARDKVASKMGVKEKSGHEKFLQKYNLTSEKHPTKLTSIRNE